jgi:Putative peptidoglycan binding domain/L,D-transpeptidase catalytic domain
VTAARSRPGALVALAVGAVLGLAACGPASLLGTPADPVPATTASTASPTESAPEPTARSTPTPTPTPTAQASRQPESKPTKTQKPTATRQKKKQLVAGPAIMARGSQGDRVRGLQARLRQIGWYSGNVTGFYGSVTTTAVRGFQARRAIPVTGEVDQRTLDRLVAMTHQPTANDLRNVTPTTSSGRLDPRCMTGRALCISKRTNSLVWAINGRPQLRTDVRFGSYQTPTREGSFTVGWKSRNHFSTIYHTSMPYAMFFSRGQAVHYSSDFAARGYSGASHGCVNVRNLSAIAWLFDQVRVGDKVIVYR